MLCLWETEELSLFSERLEPFSATFPTSGMTRGGRLFPLPQSAHHIDGNECSSLPPTPATVDGRGCVASQEAVDNKAFQILMLPSAVMRMDE